MSTPAAKDATPDVDATEKKVNGETEKAVETPQLSVEEGASSSFISGVQLVVVALSQLGDLRMAPCAPLFLCTWP
jgi:hypothetical protein